MEANEFWQELPPLKSAPFPLKMPQYLVLVCYDTFPFRVEPFPEWKLIYFDRVAAFESASFPLKMPQYLVLVYYNIF